VTKLISVENLSFAYGQNIVLEKINLEFEAGEFVALIGPNGAGKTTLLKLLAGLLKPRVGSIQTPEPKSQHIAYLAQSEPLPLEFTALEVVKLGRIPFQGFWGRETKTDLGAVECALRSTDALAFAHRQIAALSGGERQRVALARALAQDPKILLLDEPTNHLDLAHQAELMVLLRNSVGSILQTVIMVVHDLNLAALASRCILISSGMVLADGTPEQVLQPGILEDVYRTKLETLRSSDGRVVVIPRL
jgi:iron complex transport system ATP-binding protein